MAARAASGTGGRSSPVSAARSAMSEASPVETVTTPVRPASDRPAEPAAPGMELGRLEELVEVGAADHAGGGEGRVGHPVLAGQRAAVGDGGRLRLGRATDLHGEDRLAQLERPVGQGQEALRPLEALDEEDDRVGLGVVDGVGQVVADVQDDLGPAADDPAEADPGPGVDERVGHAAALGDAGDPAAGKPRVDVADVQRGVRRQVDHPHAVGPEDRQPVAKGDRRARRPASGRRPRHPPPRRRRG